MIANVIGPLGATYFVPASEVYWKMRPNPPGLHQRMENVDLRCSHLDAPRPIRNCESALHVDGGYDVKLGASFSAQVKYFQAGPLYFESSIDSERPVASRLPHRYGYEESTGHTAELAAMIASLRWIAPGAYNMFVGDRNALF